MKLIDRLANDYAENLDKYLDQYLVCKKSYEAGFRLASEIIANKIMQIYNDELQAGFPTIAEYIRYIGDKELEDVFEGELE